MTCEDCNCIHEGDVAEHIMNTDVFGVVIGFMGSLVGLRVSPSLNVLWFHTFELRRIDGDDEYTPPAKADVPEGNVIDFTKARDLRADTDTKGRA